MGFIPYISYYIPYCMQFRSVALLVPFLDVADTHSSPLAISFSFSFPSLPLFLSSERVINLLPRGA